LSVPIAFMNNTFSGAITLQCHMLLHRTLHTDLFQIFLITDIINVENSCLIFFVETMIQYFFSGFSYKLKVQKNSVYYYL